MPILLIHEVDFWGIFLFEVRENMFLTLLHLFLQHPDEILWKGWNSDS